MTEGESLQLQIHHRLVEELALKEKRYREMLEKLRNPVFVVEGGRITFLNPAWEEQLGHAPATCLGAPLERHLAPQHRAALSPAVLQSIETTGHLELAFLHQSGREIWFEISLSRDGDDRLIGTLSNIDDRLRSARLQREQAERLALLNQELLAVARQKDCFLASISHELRTPLNSVIGYAQLLREKIYGELSDEALAALGHISDAGEVLLDSVDAILEYTTDGSLPERSAETLPAEAEEVEVGALTRQVCERLEPAAAAKGIVLAVTHIAETRLRIAPQHWRRIVSNLLANAIEFAPEAGRVDVEVGDAGPGAVRLRVTDNGPGIPPAALPFIFEPFRQAGDAFTRGHGGLGLGLTVVKQLVELYGGNVSVENVPGTGAGFQVRLPRTPVACGQPVAAATSQSL